MVLGGENKAFNNMPFEKDDFKNFEELDTCSWCGSNSEEHPLWCTDPQPFKTVQCSQCGMIYVKIRLNQKGRDEYYSSYYSSVHQSQEDMNKQRDEMYAIEVKFIKNFITKGRILDVGCTGGNFLAYFGGNEWDRWGIEYGREAAKVAQRKMDARILHGELPELDLPIGTFDLVIFRGVIEHVHDPKRYLEKAIKLLAPNGKIFIGSTPNRDSLCADLFRNKWGHHIPAAHIYHFSPNDFKQFFQERALRLVGETPFYLETPYADIEKDLCLIRNAIEYRSKKKEIDFESPPFWNNLMTLIFTK